MTTQDPAAEADFIASDVGLTPPPSRGHSPREGLVRKLADIVVLPATRISANERSLVADILLQALDKADEDIRLEVSRRIARVAEAPNALLRMLLLDEPRIAEPIIRRVEPLPEALLIECAHGGVTAHREMIARRLDLQAKGSAERAGLKRGDVVVRFDGRDVMDSGQLRNLVAQSPIGSKHRLDLIRDGKAYQAELTVQEAPRERAKKSQTASASASTAHPLTGVVFDDVTPPLARQMDLAVNSGVVVTDIEEGSLAESSGLQPGDVVLELNRQPVHNFAAFQRLADPLKPTDLALLLVNRQGNALYIPIQGE